VVQIQIKFNRLSDNQYSQLLSILIKENRTMKKRISLFLSIIMIFSMVLAACAPAATEAPAAVEPTKAEVAPTEAPAVEAPTEATTKPAEAPAADKVQIRWFVGLGTGTDPNQVTVQQQVVDDFNASQDAIELVLEVVPYDSARDTLSTQIAAGAGPDIVGPVGWGGSNDFYGQWLDISPQIMSSGFDTSIFDPALLKFYQTEEGQVGLPFAVFPGAMYFVPAMFDEVELAYPPQVYGEKYVLDGNEVDWNWETVTEVAKRLTLDVNGLNSTEDGFDRTQMLQVVTAPVQSTFRRYLLCCERRFGKANPATSPPCLRLKKPSNGTTMACGAISLIATGPLSGAPEFGNGNVFNAGKAAMGLTQTWYTCCLIDYRDAGNEFQMGIQPMGADGVVNGRIDADTFRIWKGTPNPDEAFTVLAYLITTGADTSCPSTAPCPLFLRRPKLSSPPKADYPSSLRKLERFRPGPAYPDTPALSSICPIVSRQPLGMQLSRI
jgi:multiple sugar transport system substrate-binding protein